MSYYWVKYFLGHFVKSLFTFDRLEIVRYEYVLIAFSKLNLFLHYLTNWWIFLNYFLPFFGLNLNFFLLRWFRYTFS